MSYEYNLTFENEVDKCSFINKISTSPLAVRRGKNIDLRAADSNSQWSYDVRLVELVTHKCLIQVAAKSEAIYILFDLALRKMNFNIIEDGDEEYVDLEHALKPSKNR